MVTKAKVLDYTVELERGGRVHVQDGPALEASDAWTPEHLVLAALVRCSLASLQYHARRLGADAVGSGSASGRVTKREDDGRYAFVELDVRLELELEPEPVPEQLEELLRKAERDCFVGASLRAKPVYTWIVNGSAA